MARPDLRKLAKSTGRASPILLQCRAQGSEWQRMPILVPRASPKNSGPRRAFLRGPPAKRQEPRRSDTRICNSTPTAWRISLQQFGFPRRTIRPTTPLRKLLPWRNRPTRWQQTRDQLGLELRVWSIRNLALLLALLGPAILLSCMKIFLGVPLGIASIIGLSVLLVIPSFLASIP